MAAPATVRIMHGKMRNLMSLPRRRQTGSGGSIAERTDAQSASALKMRQCSRLLVIPAAAHAFGRVVETKKIHGRNLQAPTTDGYGFRRVKMNPPASLRHPQAAPLWRGQRTRLKG
jgi:hypothetical protein